MAAAGIPSSHFDSAQTAGESRFAAWQEVIGVVFDVAPLTREGLESFQASVHVSHLNQLLLVEHSFGAQQFSRRAARIARDGLDHYLVQCYRQGGFIGQCDGEQDIQVNVRQMPQAQSLWRNLTAPEEGRQLPEDREQASGIPYLALEPDFISLGV